MPTVRLIPRSVSGESPKTFDIDRNAAMSSRLIANMLQDDDETDDVEVPLPEVTEDILAFVAEFLMHHRSNPMLDIEKPIKTHDIRSIVGVWDAAFIERVDTSRNRIFDLVLAANYLDIKSLLDLGLCKIACTVKANMNDIEKLKQTFGIEGNLTPEEEKKIREENEWIFEVSVNGNTSN